MPRDRRFRFRRPTRRRHVTVATLAVAAAVLASAAATSTAPDGASGASLAAGGDASPAGVDLAMTVDAGEPVPMKFVAERSRKQFAQGGYTGAGIDVEHPSATFAEDPRLFLGSGTSQAAAVVSGAVALLLQQRPELTPDQVKDVLTATATDTFQLDAMKGHGVVNLAAAMHEQPAAKPTKHRPARGLGSLEAARGDDHVTIGGQILTGEVTVTGAAWDPVARVAASESATAWTGTDDWSGSSWSGSSWSGSSWSGSSWSGANWA